MRIGYISVMLIGLLWLKAYPQQAVSDSLADVSLSEVVITETVESRFNRNSTLHIDIADKSILRRNFTGNLVQSLDNLPGVHSMDIGSGFSKPMIRGMGFNRIAVVENGVKQEGQQWGADHGLEIDAFNIHQVNVHKGASSLQYGSDAMGGVIEMQPAAMPVEDQFFGEASGLYKSVNRSLGGSLMLGMHKDGWMTTARYSEQQFGDYRIPTDNVLYLTQKIPIYHNRLKNTAGYERNVNITSTLKKDRYESFYFFSNAYQKAGYFPGTHGTADASKAEDDGNSRNIAIPYSRVNHLKAITGQKYRWDRFVFMIDLGYQNNHREEMSYFREHYSTQQPPENNPDKELDFNLSTYSSSAKGRFFSSSWEHIFGWDMQYQRNTIGGYSFLLPEYNRFSTGAFWVSSYHINPDLKISGGIRYDYGRINIAAFLDKYLEVDLQQQGYSPEKIEELKWRSRKLKRNFNDFSASAGVVWNPSKQHIVQVNIGRSFRMPTANELSSNGVHHGSFRYEQGDASLNSEKGWQLDAAYTFETDRIKVSFSPFASWFNNYIYLQPTKEPSHITHSGQIYRFTGAEAVFAGGEITMEANIFRRLNYKISGDYTYTRNIDSKTALSYSPPPSLRNILTWQEKNYSVGAEWHLITDQNRIANNEDKTAGAGLINLFASCDVAIGKTVAEITFSARNIFDKKYYNHLSFYRKVQIPEPGRSFQLLIKVPFNCLLK